MARRERLGQNEVRHGGGLSAGGRALVAGSSVALAAVITAVSGLDPLICAVMVWLGLVAGMGLFSDAI